MFGQKPELLIADEMTLKLVSILRVIRRYVPFI